MSAATEQLAAALADRYRIERELGRGGMATVYLARDLKHDRKVALKVLTPDLAATLGHERFLREITNAANLRHPHILPLFDSGEADGVSLLCHAVRRGRDARSGSRRDSSSRSMRFAHHDGGGRSTDYAHARGLVHRDIKPENILLSTTDTRSSPISASRARSAPPAATRSRKLDSAIGTPAYMSPEQAAGESNIDGRSDQYALACLAYEMLCGQPPFTGPTAASVVHQHLAVAPRPVTQLRSALPRRGVERARARAREESVRPIRNSDRVRRGAPKR